MYRHLLAGISLLAIAAAPGAALAAPSQSGGPSAPSSSSATTGYAIVQLKDAPLATYKGGTNGIPATKPERGRLDPSSPAYRAYERFLANERANVKAFLAQKAPAAKVVAEYDTVLNAVAVELNGTSVAALAKHPKVASVEQSWTYKPTMNRSVDIIRATEVWGGQGGQAGAGAGIDVGIIDSGIVEDHPFFSCKDEITHKTYAAGTAGSGQDIVNSHGTHVAGTVGGCVTDLGAVDPEGPVDGTISGVAPGVNLHDYNVFPGYGGGYVAFGGSAFSHDIARAVEDAVDEGMDVINLSLGGAVQGKHDYLAEAINAAAAAGVVPVVSAGNEGPDPATVGSPGNAMDALTVGATTNSHYVGVNVVTEDGSFGAAVGDFDPFAENPVSGAPLVAWSSSDPQACAAQPAGTYAGAVVLIQRGTCAFADKVANAAAAGAIGVVVYNNSGGDPTAMGGTGTIPAVMVSDVDGAALLGGLPSTVTIDGSDPVEVLTDNADIMAGFSSRGPGPFTDNLKPDVTAPGVNIYSSVFDETVGTDATGWEMFQGTSMAAPHVAGSAALLLAQDGDLSPADVKSKLGNNAEREVWKSAVGGALATVLERGGGRIDLVRASAATATFDPMSLSFGISNGNKPVSKSISVTVKNLADRDRTFTVTEVSDHLTAPGSVTVPAGSTTTFDVTLKVRGPVTEEGDITVTDGSETFLVPYYFSTGN